MKIRLYIGRRRYRREWIKIDDIFYLDGEKEIIHACTGAKALLDSTRQQVHWHLSQVDKIFHGNIWETVREFELKDGQFVEIENVLA